MSGIFDEGETRLRACIVYLTGRLDRTLRVILERDLIRDDVTYSQWLLLAALHWGKARNGAEMARFLDIDATAVTRLLDRLEAKGLVRKTPNPADRRAFDLELTEEGRRLAPQLAERCARAAARVLHGLSTDETALALACIERMAANAEAEKSKSKPSSDN